MNDNCIRYDIDSRIKPKIIKIETMQCEHCKQDYKPFDCNNELVPINNWYKLYTICSQCGQKNFLNFIK